MKDIALAANVSIATVSHVINKSRFVKKETADKVLGIIKEKKYKTGQLKSSLKYKGFVNKSIGVIVNDSSNPLLAALIKNIEQSANAEGYNLIVCNSSRDPKKDVENINSLIKRKVDGFIICSSSEDIQYYDNISKFDMPAVLIERKIEGLDRDIVWGDHYNAAIEVVDYLAGLGHSKIAYMHKDISLYQSQLRLKGFMDGLKKNNIDPDEDLILRGGGFWPQDGYIEIQKIFYSDNIPTAIIAFNDLLAMGLIRAIQDRNLSVPDDFSVIGADNLFFSDYTYPRLTTVTYKKKDIAQNAVKLLIERIDGKKGKTTEISLPLRLIIRESTGKAG